MKSDQVVQTDATQAKPGWRIKVGFALFIMSLGWPVLLPILPFIGLSGTQIAALSGAMLVVAELLLLAGVAIAGKEGFAYIKAKVFGVLKAYGPPKTVSRARYSIGLVIFMIPFVFAWAAPYFGEYIPGFTVNIKAYAIGGDLMLLVGLILLGGDFWEKLRSLFIHRAYAVIPEKSVKEGAAN